MTMKKPDLREYERLEGDKIPEKLKDFSIDSGLGDKHPASVTDFSPKGIRLLVKDPGFQVSHREVLLLTPAGEPLTLAGEVIHNFPDGSGGHYLGILFLSTKSRQRYREIIG
jgi:hypothetical protein